MNKISLKTLLLLISMVPVLISSFIFTSYYSYQAFIFHESEERLKTKELLTFIAIANEYNIAIQNKEALKRIALQLIKHNNFKTVTFYNSDNEIITQADNTALHDKDNVLATYLISLFQFSDAFTTTVADTSEHYDDVFLQEPDTANQNKALGKITVKINLIPLATKQLNFFIQYLSFLLLVLIIIFLIINKVVKRINHQFNRIETTLSHIENDTYQEKDENYSIHELARIHTSVSSMSKTISESKLYLNSQIESATQNLQHALKELEIKNALLIVSKKTADEQNKFKTQFLAQMSHELRTPLNSIIGFTELLMLERMTDKTFEKVLTIQKSSNNLLGLINNILDLNLIEKGKVKIEEEETDLTEVLNEVLNILLPLAENKHLSLSLEGEENISNYVLTDKQKIKQILINYGSNAIKFTQTGSVKIIINKNKSTKAYLDLDFHIIDTGMGIHKDEVKSLFKEYSQANEHINSKFGGSGLGLFISKNIIEQLGGSTSIVSTSNQGTHFKINLKLKVLDKVIVNHSLTTPIKTIVYLDSSGKGNLNTNFFKHAGFSVIGLNDFDVNSKSEHTILLANISSKLNVRTQIDKLNKQLLPLYIKKYFYITPYSQSENINFKRLGFDGLLYKSLIKEKFIQDVNNIFNNTYIVNSKAPTTKPKHYHVLAVDDNPTNLKLISAFIDASKIHLTMAENGAKAIQLCEKKAFDLILMDLQMPEIDGLEATKTIKTIPLNNSTPIIAITADAFKDTKIMTKKCGMATLLEKPFTIKQLNQIFENYLYNKQASPQIDQKDAVTTLYDKKLALNLTNGDEQLASGILEIFIQNLKEQEDNIEQSIKQKDFKKLYFYSHKIHSAVCYCGIPVIEELSKLVELKSKNNESEAFKQASILLAKLLEFRNEYYSQIAKGDSE